VCKIVENLPTSLNPKAVAPFKSAAVSPTLSVEVQLILDMIRRMISYPPSLLLVWEYGILHTAKNGHPLSSPEPIFAVCMATQMSVLKSDFLRILPRPSPGPIVLYQEAFSVYDSTSVASEIGHFRVLFDPMAIILRTDDRTKPPRGCGIHHGLVEVDGVQFEGRQPWTTPGCGIQHEAQSLVAYVVKWVMCGGP